MWHCFNFIIYTADISSVESFLTKSSRSPYGIFKASIASFTVRCIVSIRERTYFILDLNSALATAFAFIAYQVLHIL